MILGGNIPILEEISQRHNSRGSDGHKESMSSVSSTLHQCDIPCSKKGEIIKRKIKGIQKGGATPRRIQAGGETPRGE
jgi:hypothetical protein